MVTHELLFDYGFLNNAGKEKFGHMSVEERKKLRNDESFVFSPSDFTDGEKMYFQTDINNPSYEPEFSGYPASNRRYRLVHQDYQLSVEESYYWILGQIMHDHGFSAKDLVKISDVFSASELSSYWGVSAQRLSIQQDRAAQYLRFIADMTKTMFQLIRDLNIVDEKLGYYNQTYDEDPNVAQDGEIVLKGQYADLVEGGPKNPSSIFGMAQNFNFVTLPTIFFQTRVPGKTLEEIKKNIHPFVQKQKFGNKTFKDVLERKLSQYYSWKYRTHGQLKTYRKLYKSYLKQHYNNIKLYMQWVKPYLKNIKSLSPNRNLQDSPEIVGAFENQLIEIEYLAVHPIGTANSVILVNFGFRTFPHMEYVPNSQERRSVMMGKLEMNLKSYAWTKEQIENYRKMKDEEDMELLKDIDMGIHEAMDSMKDDIMHYLGEKDKGDEPEAPVHGYEGPKYKIDRKSGKVVKIKTEAMQQKANQDNVLSPFVEVVKGFGLFAEPFKFSIPKKSVAKGASKKDMEAAKKHSKQKCYLLSRFYKKSHNHISW